MKKALVIVLVLVPLTLYAQDYSDWNTGAYFGTATVESVKRYLKAGAKLTARGGELGLTPLHYAAWKNKNPEVITALLKAGADIDARDKGGNTPLHKAARDNNSEIIAVLLNAGAKVNARDKNGSTPLHWAALNNPQDDEFTKLVALYPATLGGIE